MKPPQLTAEEAGSLVDELADALQRMVETSCRDMAPLWLAGTRLQRRDLGETAVDDLSFEPSPKYLRLQKGGQNRYRQLACWRHTVIWKDGLSNVDDDFVRATRAIYFTPYPPCEPPYAWSQKVSDAPDASEFKSATTLKEWAKEGCWRSVREIRTLFRELPNESVRDELDRKLVKTGCRDTLRDALKLEHFDNWEPM